MNRHSVVFSATQFPSALLEEVIRVALDKDVSSVLMLTNYPLLAFDARGQRFSLPNQEPRSLEDVLELARELLGKSVGDAVNSERRDFQVSVSIPGRARLSVYAQVSRSMPTLFIRASRELDLEAAWKPLQEEPLLQELCRSFGEDNAVTVLCAPHAQQAYELAIGVASWLAHHRDNTMVVSLEEGMRSFVRHTARNPFIQREIGFDVETISDALDHLERVDVGGLVVVPDASFLNGEDAKRLLALNAPVILGMRCEDRVAAGSVFGRLGVGTFNARIYFYSEAHTPYRAQRVQQQR